MPLATWLRTLKTRLDPQQSRRTCHRPAARKRATAKPRLERLEDRLALAAGVLDTSFSGDGFTETAFGSYYETNNTVKAVAVQPNGKTVVGSSVYTSSGYNHFAFARYELDGTLDSTFGTGGALTVGFGIQAGLRAISIQPDGKIVAAGIAGANLALVRLNANGSLDTTFGDESGGQPTGKVLMPLPGGLPATSVALQPDGKIIVGGSFDSVAANADFAVFRYTAAGQLDSTFNGTGISTTDFFGYSDPVFAVALQPDGKIIAAGHANYRTPTGGFDADCAVVRFNVDGTLDSTFGVGGKATYDLDNQGNISSATAVGIQALPSGSFRIILSGTSELPQQQLVMTVAALDPSGNLDATFGTGGVVQTASFQLSSGLSGTLKRALASVVQPDQKIVVGVTGTNVSFGLVRYTPDGAVDTSFGDNGFSVTNQVNGKPILLSNFNGIALAPDGRIVAAGQIDMNPAVPHSKLAVVARYLGDPDDDTKFYVVNDATTNVTYEYADQGASVENYSLASGNSAPRGAASTAAGDKVWVVDANRNVYVYNASGGLLGSWTAGTIAANAVVEGVATDGTDIWIVDAKSDKVFRFAGAASRLSGSQTAASSFSLNSGNKDPKDIVTDGSSLWVVNDSGANKVFKYTLGGAFLGSWTIDAANANPTGITIDPTNVSNIWIVDSGTDRVYQYNAAATRTSGSQSAGAVFALAAGNTNPQGIADPPPAGGDRRAMNFSEGVRHADFPAELVSLNTGSASWRHGSTVGRSWSVDASAWDNFEFTTPGKHEASRFLRRESDGDGMKTETRAAGARRTRMDDEHSAEVDQVFGLLADGESLAWLDSVDISETAGLRTRLTRR